MSGGGPVETGTPGGALSCQLLLRLAAAAIARNDLQAARDSLQAIVPHLTTNPRLAPDLIEASAALCAAVGDARQALRLCGASTALRAELEGTTQHRANPQVQEQIQKAWNTLSDDAASTEWLAGRGMSLEQAMTTALAVVQPPKAGRSK